MPALMPSLSDAVIRPVDWLVMVIFRLGETRSPRSMPWPPAVERIVPALLMAMMAAEVSPALPAILIASSVPEIRPLAVLVMVSDTSVSILVAVSNLIARLAEAVVAMVPELIRLMVPPPRRTASEPLAPLVRIEPELAIVTFAEVAVALSKSSAWPPVEEMVPLLVSSSVPEANVPLRRKPSSAAEMVPVLVTVRMPVTPAGVSMPRVPDVTVPLLVSTTPVPVATPRLMLLAEVASVPPAAMVPVWVPVSDWVVVVVVPVGTVKLAASVGKGAMAMAQRMAVREADDFKPGI